MSHIAIDDELKSAIILLAGDRAFFETRQRWLEKAARAAGISYRSAKAAFYCEGENPGSKTVEKIRRAIAARNAKEEANARSETCEILERIAFLEQRLGSNDQRFHSGKASGVIKKASAQSRQADLFSYQDRALVAVK